MSLPRTNKFKSVPYASKVTLTLFCGCIGPILNYCQDCQQMVSSVWYCVALEELKPAVHSRRRVVLRHDSAEPHMAPVTVERIYKLKF